jgi:branched-chain amino acid transport system substrate-binding protein
LGLQRLAVFYLNNDWGLSSYELFVPRVEELGAEVVSVAPYLAEEVDFRSALTAARDANPDAIILFSYQADGALIAQQLQQAGLDVPIVGASPIQSPDYLELGGEAVEGTYILGQFLDTDTRPHVKAVVDAYVAKYNETPDFFAMHAYDTMKLIAQAIEIGGPTREGVHSALPQVKDVPSVIYGSASFNPETRRVQDPEFVGLQVQNGEFVLWDGTQPGE